MGRRRFAVALLATASFSASARAQLTSTIADVQVRTQVDERGVDMVTGTFNAEREWLTFGPNAATRLHYASMIRANVSAFDLDGFAQVTSEGGKTYVYATRGADTYKFLQSGTTFTSVLSDGAQLSSTTAGTYDLVEPDGTKVQFFTRSNYKYGSTYLRQIAYIQYTDGEKLTFTPYESQYRECTGGGVQPLRATGSSDATATSGAAEPSSAKADQTSDAASSGAAAPAAATQTCTTLKYSRVQAISSNLGFQLRFGYDSDSAEFAGFNTLNSVTAVNTRIDPCDPAQPSCTYSRAWPRISISRNGATTSTQDSLGNTWTSTTGVNGAQLVTTVRRPNGKLDYEVAISNGKVDSVKNEVGTWSYVRNDTGNSRTSWVSSPLVDKKRTITADIDTGLIRSDTNKDQKTTRFSYDPAGRLLEVRAPDGNGLRYSYDSRGNVTEIDALAKDTTSSYMLKKATFPASCSNTMTCNKPTDTTDGRRNVTNYTYDPVHGGVLDVDAPSVTFTDPATLTTGSARPHTEHRYVSFTAPGGGTVYREKSVFSCRSSDCTGAKKVGVDRAWGASGGLSIALLAESQGASDGSLYVTTTLAYDDYGNLATVDGPLAGTGDTTRFRYDQAHRVSGVIGPNRGDGRWNPAVRTFYDSDGNVFSVDEGVVSSQADSDWNSFNVHRNSSIGYDAAGRKIWQRIVRDGTSYAMTAFSYDADGRTDCVAVRMDPTLYSSSVGACDLTSVTASQKDRIQRFEYDEEDRITKAWSGYRTDDARAETTIYTGNGKAQFVSDGKGNKTEYGYDTWDRLQTISLPNPSTSLDRIVLDYDENGNVKRRYLRQTGQYQDYVYDAMNRLTQVITPHLKGANNRDVASDKYRWIAYDLTGQPLLFSEENNNNVSFAYDALGRVIQQWTPSGGAKVMTYDARGQRTSLKWQDNFYVTYSYDIDGNISNIKENGNWTIASFGYNDDGRRTSLCRWNDCDRYTYDPIGRLSTLRYEGRANPVTMSFEYDAAGGITRKQISDDAYALLPAETKLAYATNSLNQYTSVSGNGIGYDAQGNVSSSGGTKYYYDSYNRLNGYGDDSDNRRYYYDAAGKLQWSWQAQRRFDYVGDELTTELDASSNIARRYILVPGSDEPILWYEGSGNADKRFLDTDERGSVTRITDMTGNLFRINRYDEYGLPSSNNLGSYQYTGQVWLPEISMYYYKARLYSPNLGRFMQTDPNSYDDGLNWYNYVGGDPINNTDSLGLGKEFREPFFVPRADGSATGGGNGGSGAGGEAAQEIYVLGWIKKYVFGLADLFRPSDIRGGRADTGDGEGTPHYYEVNRDSRCSASAVFNKFKKPGGSAPGAPAAKEGLTGLITLSGNNNISQYVNSSNYTIVNTTLYPHVFHPGSVVIRVTPNVGGGSHIRIVGSGSGRFATLNNVAGKLIFGQAAAAAGDGCGSTTYTPVHGG